MNESCIHWGRFGCLDAFLLHRLYVLQRDGINLNFVPEGEKEWVDVLR